jgi:(1->4)-alpha-D-glucan 1-alpha-D-glucosylmutase
VAPVAAPLAHVEPLAAHARARQARASANDEYLLYQTLLGTFPAGSLGGDALDAYRDRIERYALKAAREAKRTPAGSTRARSTKRHSANSCARCSPPRAEPVFRGPARAGAGNRVVRRAEQLSMALLKLTSPGVPDLYQGNELLDFSLVDPDNRRRSDYELRERALAELAAIAEEPDLATAARALAEQPHDGRAKLFVIWRLLQARRRMPDLFRDGTYQPCA